MSRELLPKQCPVDVSVVAGQRIERSEIVIIVDYVQNGEVYYRRWRSGSDGSIQGDWDHFIGANRMSADAFLRALKKR